MTAQIAPSPNFKGWDNNGFPLAFGLLTTYAAGTTTPQATYVDSTQTTQNTNPIQLNFRGECNLWLDPTKAYKFLLQDSAGNTIPGWPIDNITIGNANPTYNIVPSVDNLYTLGTVSFAWANVYVGPNHVPILAPSGNVGYYVRTAAEIAAGATPTDFSYLADPYVDPRRYGADPTGVTVSTTAVQTAINVALQANGVVWIGNKCNFLVGPLTANLVNGQGLRIMGSSPGGSKLTQSGNPSALLTISGPTPTGAPIDAPVFLENFTITLSTNTCDGVVVLGLGRFVAQRVWMSAGGNRCFFLNSALSVWIEKCFLENALYGIYARTDGAGAPPNLVILRDNSFGGNLIYAVDYDTGSELQMFSNDIEGNGTNATFTANPGLNANAGTLTAVWPLPTGAYNCAFPDGSAKTMNFTFNSTAVTWSGGNAAQTAAWISTPTGAIHIGPLINAFPTFGLAKVMLENNWIESNNGGWSIKVDAPTAGQQTNITIRGGHVVAPPNNQSVLVAGATRLKIEDFYAPSPNDTCNLTATYAELVNFLSSVLTDTGITYPTYINVATSTGTQPNGRVSSFVGTLTTAGGATGTILTYQQGKTVRLVFPTLDGTSTGTTATITGMPASITPSADRQVVARMLDNNVEFIGAMTIGANSIITLTKPGGTFTAANSKGVQGATVGPYDL